MARFHLHVVNGPPLWDSKGQEFADLEAAKNEARAWLKVFDATAAFKDSKTVKITDDTGAVVALVS
ncbi:MAG: hypothetical protein JO205_04905 [Pseudolabrys sp.]|nr:hypothetical protein [Pseudolabrys sp.]